MDIGYLWDEEKYALVLEKHNISFSEVVAAMEDSDAIEEGNFVNGEERWMLTGSTEQGRIIIVIFTEEDLPHYRIVTAFVAEGERLDAYKERARERT